MFRQICYRAFDGQHWVKTKLPKLVFANRKMWVWTFNSISSGLLKKAMSQLVLKKKSSKEVIVGYTNKNNWMFQICGLVCTPSVTAIFHLCFSVLCQKCVFQRRLNAYVFIDEVSVWVLLSLQNVIRWIYHTKKKDNGLPVDLILE